MLWVQLPPEPLKKCPRGAARSARHSVTVEIVGSNPIEDAEGTLHGTQTRQSGQAQTLVTLWVRFPPVQLECVGWAWASLDACKASAIWLCRFNSCSTHFCGFGEPRGVSPRPIFAGWTGVGSSWVS